MRANSLCAAWSLAVFVLLTGASCSPAQGFEASTAAETSQIVSQTGLLPVYGVDLCIDPSWVDGSAFPSKAVEFPNYGASPAFQQIWDALKPVAFNSIRFRVDLKDAKNWGYRTANLCVWGAANGVKLVPVLAGSSDAALSTDAAEFVKTLAGAVRSDTQNVQAYSQILCFQVGDRMNHAGLHPGTSADASAKLVLAAASALRAAEQTALKDSGIYASPIMVNLSFDYELVKAKSMAGVTLTDAAYDAACQSAKQFIKGLAEAADVDIINLEWFPGSIGAGSVDKLSKLLSDLKADFAGKQFMLTTGFSVGFNPPADQKTYYAAAFTNLVQYRAQESADGTFLGVFFHEALDSAVPDPPPPTADLPSQIAQWDWAAKSDELAAMWSGGKTSAELSWWLSKTENHMGVLVRNTDQAGASTFAPQPGFDALLTIAGAVTDANAAMASQPTPAATTDTSAAAYPTSDTSASAASSGTSYRSKLKEGLFGLIDKVFQKIGDKITATGTGGAAMTGDWSSSAAPTGTPYPTTDTSTYPSMTTAVPSVSIGLAASDVTFNPPSPQVGQQVSTTMTLHNQSPDTEATGLSVALVDSNGYVVGVGAQQSGINVAANGTKQVVLSWTPTQAGSFSLSTEVYDAYLAKVASAPVALTVTGSAAPASSTGAGGIECSKSDISVIPSSPSAGVSAKVRVKLRNTGSQDVSGLDLLLVDTEADPSTSLLGEVNGKSVGKSSQKQIDINWTPTAEKTYQLAVQVWPGYDPMLFEVALDPVTVTATSAAPSSDGPGPSTSAGAFAVKQVTVQPSSPKAGQQALLKVGMRNDSATDVSNLDVYLVDSSNTSIALAQTSVAQVAKGKEKNADLSWRPDIEGQYALEVQLWDAGGMLASKPVNVTVAAAASGGGGGGGSGGSGSGSGRGTIKKPDLGVLQETPQPGPDPWSSALGPILSKVPLGLPAVQEFEVGGGTAEFGSTVPVRVSLVNTFNKPVTNVSLTLMADGKQVETRSLGTLIPGQSRSVEFGGIKLPEAGKHVLQVVLQGEAGKLLSGSVEREFNVSTRMLATTGALSSGKQPLMRPAVLKAPLVPRTAVASVRTVLPTAFSIGGKEVATGAPLVPQVPTAGTLSGKPGSLPKIQPAPTASAGGSRTVATRPVTTPTATTGSGTGEGTKTTVPTIPGVTPTATATATPTILRPTIPTTATGAEPAKTTPTIPGVAPTTTATATRPTATTIPGVTPTAPTATPTVPATTAPVRATVPPVSPTASPTVPTVTPTVPTAATTGPIVKPTVPSAAPTVSPTVPTTAAPSAVGTTTPPLSSTTTPTVVRPTSLPTVTSPTTATTAGSTTPVVKPTTETVVPTVTPITSPTAVAPTVLPGVTPTTPTTTAPTVPAPATTAASPTVGRVLPAVIKPDLAVTSADIHCAPTSPKVGETIMFSITVRNLAGAAADGASLICVFRADGAQVARKEFSLNVAANGSALQQWQLATPRAKQLSLEVAVSHSADTATANNHAAVTLNVQTMSR